MAASDGERIVELLLRPYLLAPRITVDEDILVDVDDEESEWTDIMATCSMVSSSSSANEAVVGVIVIMLLCWVIVWFRLQHMLRASC